MWDKQQGGLGRAGKVAAGQAEAQTASGMCARVVAIRRTRTWPTRPACARIASRPRRDFCSFGPRGLPSRLLREKRRRRRRQLIAAQRGLARALPAGRAPRLPEAEGERCPAWATARRWTGSGGGGVEDGGRRWRPREQRRREASPLAPVSVCGHEDDAAAPRPAPRGPPPPLGAGPPSSGRVPAPRPAPAPHLRSSGSEPQVCLGLLAWPFSEHLQPSPSFSSRNWWWVGSWSSRADFWYLKKKIFNLCPEFLA